MTFEQADRNMSSKVFRTSYRVAWADTDAAQVVHYSNYFRLFERAEEDFYRHLGFSFTDLRTKGLWFPRVEAFCQYKKPARFNDLLEIELAVEELREKSVKYGFRIVSNETNMLLATGHVVVVAADKQAGKATQIPREIVEKLKPFCK
jgi:acyl-CoA thioester hydrolase